LPGRNWLHEKSLLQLRIRLLPHSQAGRRRFESGRPLFAETQSRTRVKRTHLRGMVRQRGSEKRYTYRFGNLGVVPCRVPTVHPFTDFTRPGARPSSPSTARITTSAPTVRPKATRSTAA